MLHRVGQSLADDVVRRDGDVVGYVVVAEREFDRKRHGGSQRADGSAEPAVQRWRSESGGHGAQLGHRRAELGHRLVEKAVDIEAVIVEVALGEAQ